MEGRGQQPVVGSWEWGFGAGIRSAGPKGREIPTRAGRRTNGAPAAQARLPVLREKRRPFDSTTHEWGTQPPGQCTSDGEVYLDLSFIILILPFTSFFTNVIGIGSPIGKLTMAFVVG